MARRLLIAAFAALLAMPAMANDRAATTTRESGPRVPRLTALEIGLDQIFARLQAPPQDTPAGVSAEMPIREVLMVRVKDGKPVLACVDSKEAAKGFLNAPVAKIGTTVTAEDH